MDEDFADLILGDAPAFVPKVQEATQEHPTIRAANGRVLVRDRSSPDYDPYNETSGLCIPVPKQPHPLVDYQRYSVEGGMIDLDPENSRDAMMLGPLLRIEDAGGVLKFLWYTADEVCDAVFEDSYDNLNKVICEYYINNLVIPARIETLSAFETLSERDDWPYEAFANGYHLAHIANTLRISKAKLMRDYMKGGSKLVSGQISRTVAMLDNAHQIQDHMMTKTIAANITGQLPDKDEQKYMNTVSKMMADIAPIMTNVAKAYVPDFAPKTQKLQVEPVMPSISINTYAEEETPYQRIGNEPDDQDILDK